MFFSSKKRTIQTHSSNHNLSHQWKKNTFVPCVILLHHLACLPVAMCGGAA